MNKRNASQSSLFLIELIFVIFFFSLTSMLCVQVFVKAHLTGKEAKEESLGSTLVSSVAEALSYMDTSNTDTPFEELFPKAKETKDGWQIAYDENGTAVSSNNATYYLTIIKETNDHLNHYSIVLKDADGDSIDTLDLKTAIPRTADEKRRTLNEKQTSASYWNWNFFYLIDLRYFMPADFRSAFPCQCKCRL